MKKYLICFLILLFTSPVWAYTETFYVCEGGDGTLPETATCATAWDVADFENAANWDATPSVSDDGDIGPDDLVVWMSDGGVFRPADAGTGGLAIGGSGLDGYPITITAQSGDNVEIRGSTVVSTWSEAGGGWQTVFDYTMDTDAGSGESNFDTRNVIPASKSSYDGTHVRVTMEAHGSNASTYNQVTICESTSNDDCDDSHPTADSFESFLFSSSESTGAITAGSTLASDSLEFAFDKTKRYLINWHQDTKYLIKDTDEHDVDGYYYLGGGSYAKTQNISGTNTASQIAGVKKLEVYAAGGANIWSATLTTEPKIVFFNGTEGTHETGTCPDDLNADQEWCWDSNTLYQYSTSDPDTRYTSPGTEATQVQATYGIFNFSGKDYVTLDGTTGGGTFTVSQAQGRGISIHNGSDYVTIKNLTVKQTWDYGIITHDDGGADVTNFTIDNNVVHSIHQIGISISNDSKTGTVSRNTVYDTCERDGTTGSWAGIKTWQSQNVTIEYNKVYSNGDVDEYDANGAGIWVDQVQTGTTTVRYNLSYSNYFHEILVERTSNAVVYGNVLYGAGTHSGKSCIAVVGNSGGVAQNNVFYNNSCHSTGMRTGLWSYATDATADAIKDNIFRNNIFGGSPTLYDLYADDGGDNTGVGSGNIYDSNSWGAEAISMRWNDTTYTTYDAFISASSQTDNNVESDPAYTSSTDLTLQPSSPAIGAGVDLGAYDCLDISSSWPSSVTTKNQNLYTPGWEIGAYCFPMMQGPGVGLMQ
jgi:hypothetical protein